MIMVLVSPHSWMRLVESSNTNKEVSGASEVPQSRGKLIFSVSVSDGQSSCTNSKTI